MKHITSTIKRSLCVLLASTVFLLAGCSSAGDGGDSETGAVYSTSEIESGAPVTVAPAATPDNAPENISVSYSEALDGERRILLDGDRAELAGDGLSIDGNVITVSESGSYTITGRGDNVQIYVNADGDVELILADCSISCADSAAIFAAKASSLRITLAGETSNSIAAFTNTSTLPDEPDAAIYSKADLIFGGEGSLTIETAIGNGITGKDTLSISGGSYYINAGNNAVKGKDCVIIGGGSFELTAGNDGIKATNSDSPTLGYVNITGGTFVIEAGGDGICAESSLIINGGSYDITCGGGAANASSSAGAGNGFFGIQSVTASDEISAKGLKAGSDVTIYNGSFILDCADDAIHSNGIVNYNGGTASIASGDDGLHSDTTLNINGGSINITRSYEGLEANEINITGGEITLVSSDDGINAADGTSSSSTFGDRGGMMSAGSSLLTITGGRIVVNAGGDGVDANGSVVMTGGELYVFGPVDSANGALDYDSSFSINGGVFVALGSAGMAQYPSTSSTQPSVAVATNGAAGDTITLADANGEVIVSVQSPKSYATAIISAPSLQIGSTYTVTAGAQSFSLTLSSSVTSSGTAAGGWGGWGGGAMGGGAMGGGARPGGIR